MNRRSVRPVSSLVSRMSALPSGDSAMPASTHGVPASGSSAAVRRCNCTRMRRTRASFICSGVGAAPPPGPGPSPGPRITICMPPPMPPRLAVSSHAVVPFSTDVRSIVGPPTMPPICISSTRFILSGRAMRERRRALHVASAHRAAERSFSGQTLERRRSCLRRQAPCARRRDPGDAILRRERRDTKCRST